jgi:hypothetical protein
MSMAISTLKKVELQNELTELGIEFSAKDTVPILRELLKEARLNIRSLEPPSDPQPKTPPLSTLNKGALFELMKENGLRTTVSTTKDACTRALTEHYRSLEVPKGDDKMTIGKHEGLMYATIKAEDPSYCNWARETVTDGPSHSELRRFVRWLDTPVALTEPVKPLPKKSSRGTSSSKPANDTRQELEKLKAEMAELKKKLSTQGGKRSAAETPVPMDTAATFNPEIAQLTETMTIMMNRMRELEMQLLGGRSATSSQDGNSWIQAETPSRAEC